MDQYLPYTLFWAGSSLEFTFTGEELHLIFETDFDQIEPWIAIELNGAFLLRMPLERGTTQVCLFRGMTTGIPRHVRVFKETQPITGDPRHCLAVKALRGTGGDFRPVPPRPLFLEFVGDSLTSGEGLAGGREENDWVSPLFRASQSWARRTADLLEADFCAVSQSGWGVCSGWDGDLHHAVPRWYAETRPLRDREPDAVIINLGTNDTSAIEAGLGSGSIERFEEAALAFLEQLRLAHPAARLVWAYGMLGDSLRPQLEQAVWRFGDACYLPLPPVNEETMGSRQHPGPLCHQAAAETMAEFLKTIL